MTEEVKRKRGRPRTRPFVVDEIATATQLVEFYEKRLSDAEERLGAAVAAAERKKTLRRGVRPEG